MSPALFETIEGFQLEYKVLYCLQIDQYNAQYHCDHFHLEAL